MTPEGISAHASLLVLAVFLPLFGAALLPFFGRQPNLREAVSITTSLALFCVLLQVLDIYFAGKRPSITLWEFLPGFTFTLALRPLGMLFALVASFLWIVTTLYSIGYMRRNREEKHTRFFVCFALAIAATMGAAFSSNLFTLFICYEMLTLSTYPLVTHKGDAQALNSGRSYIGVLMGTSLGLLLPAILITWHIAGTLDFAQGGILGTRLSPLYTGILLALYLFGIAKAALMPMHRWLPAAMVAPAPVSALLHAVAVVKTGVFCIVTVITYTFGVESLSALIASDWKAGAWVPYTAGTTLLLASLVALRQDNLKLRLAYSTVSQLAYVVMAASLLAPLSMVGAILHIAAHAFGKITLFFAAGAIYTTSHKTQVSELGGIGRAMPWTMAAFAVGAFSLIGVPPTIGFVSKWYMLLGAMETRHYFAAIILVLSTVLNAAYFLPIVHTAFFKKPQTAQSHGEAPKIMLLAMTITSGATIALFFSSGTLLKIAADALSIWEPLHLP